MEPIADQPYRPRADLRPESLGVMLVRIARFPIGWAITIFYGTTKILGSFVGLGTQAYKACGKPWANLTFKAMAIKTNVVGKERLERPALYTSNHQSFIDVLLVVTLIPVTSRYVVRKMLTKVPFFGWAAREGLIAVQRRTNNGVSTLQEGLAALPEGWSISIFPEGTRSATGLLSPVRKGIVYMALQSRLPIVPVGSWGNAAIIPLGTFLPRSGPIEVTVGEEISTENWSVDTLDQHLEEIRVALQAVTDVSRGRYEAKYGVCEPNRRNGSWWNELTGNPVPEGVPADVVQLKRAS